MRELIRDIRERMADEEQGAVLVIAAVFLPVALLCAVFAVDMANWWVHRRHAQTQADAAVLAAAQNFQFPCNATVENAITAKALEYAGGLGATYNKQIGDPARANTAVRALINSPTYFNQPSPSDDTNPSICAGMMIDAKVTELDLPFFFEPVHDVNFINAHARASIEQLGESNMTIPFGLPGTEPKLARAFFINETTGASLGSVALDKCGKVGGLTQFSNGGCGAFPPNPLPVNIAAEDVGVRIALGQNSTTCGDDTVVCYDHGSANGLLHIRGYVEQTNQNHPNNTEPPVARGVTLTNGTCSDAYFTENGASTCNVGIQAEVDFQDDAYTNPGPNGVPIADVFAVVGGTDYPLVFNPTTDLWESAAAVLPIPANAGPVNVNLRVEQKDGHVGGNQNNDECRANRPCVATFTQVQRPFSADGDRSGPIEVAQVSEGATFNVNNLERGTTHDLAVTIGVRGLQNATSLNEPKQFLRRNDSQQTHSLDCKPPANRFDQIEFGCAGTYQLNTTPDSSCAIPVNPPNCVDAAPGTADVPTMDSLSERINGGNGNTCTHPNRWSTASSLTDLLSQPDDPRFVGVIVVPFGTYENLGNGSKPVAVLDFARFYITGFGPGNPCNVGPNGDDAAQDGEIVGHFVKYVETSSTGGGNGTPCDPNAFSGCVAVLTE